MAYVSGDPDRELLGSGVDVADYDAAAGEYWNNRSHTFAVRNAGKKSVMLDLASDEGRSILFRLLEDAGT